MDNDDTKLSRLLKDHAPAYIDDAGFTGRVMNALPPPSRKASSLRRPLLLLSSSLLSILLTFMLAGPGFSAGLSALIQHSVEYPALQVSGLSIGALPLACFICGLGIAALLSYRLLRENNR